MKNFSKDEVLDAAYIRYGKPVCVDMIDEAMRQETLDEAVMVIIDDSKYWDYDPRPLDN